MAKGIQHNLLLVCTSRSEPHFTVAVFFTAAINLFDEACFRGSVFLPSQWMEMEMYWKEKQTWGYSEVLSHSNTGKVCSLGRNLRSP